MDLKMKEANTMPQGGKRKYLTYDQAKNYLSNFENLRLDHESNL
jgi:hypothetical protein